MQWLQQKLYIWNFSQNTQSYVSKQGIYRTVNTLLLTTEVYNSTAQTFQDVQAARRQTIRISLSIRCRSTGLLSYYIIFIHLGARDATQAPVFCICTSKPVFKTLVIDGRTNRLMETQKKAAIIIFSAYHNHKYFLRIWVLNGQTDGRTGGR